MIESTFVQSWKQTEMSQKRKTFSNPANPKTSEVKRAWEDSPFSIILTISLSAQPFWIRSNWIGSSEEFVGLAQQLLIFNFLRAAYKFFSCNYFHCKKVTFLKSSSSFASIRKTPTFKTSFVFTVTSDGSGSVKVPSWYKTIAFLSQKINCEREKRLWRVTFLTFLFEKHLLQLLMEIQSN